MVEPDLKYCPKCNDEYRAEIEKCAACNIALITGSEKIERDEARRKELESRVRDVSPDDDLVRIRRGTLPEIQHLVKLLDRERLGTVIVGDLSTCGKDRFGNTLSTPTSYDLMVKRETGMMAMQIIDAEHRRTTALELHDPPKADSVFNPEAGEACCPACGNCFPTTETSCPDCGLSFG